MKAASILWRLALAALLSISAYFAYQFGLHAGEWFERIVERETTRFTASATQNITESRREILGEVASLRKDLMHQADAIRRDANAQLQDISQKADAQLQRTNDSIAGLREDIRPSLAHLENVTARADEASSVLFARNGLPAQLLGVTAAAKVTLGEAAQTMRTVREETPIITANIKRATDESAQTARQTQQVMTNLAASTKPLPKYLRYPLAVAGAIASPVAGALTAAAATGAFR